MRRNKFNNKDSLKPEGYINKKQEGCMHDYKPSVPLKESSRKVNCVACLFL